MNTSTSNTTTKIVTVGSRRVEVLLAPRRDDYAWDAAFGWMCWASMPMMTVQP